MLDSVVKHPKRLYRLQSVFSCLLNLFLFVIGHREEKESSSKISGRCCTIAIKLVRICTCVRFRSIDVGKKALITPGYRDLFDWKELWTRDMFLLSRRWVWSNPRSCALPWRRLRSRRTNAFL